MSQRVTAMITLYDLKGVRIHTGLKTRDVQIAGENFSIFTTPSILRDLLNSVEAVYGPVRPKDQKAKERRNRPRDESSVKESEEKREASETDGSGIAPQD